MYEICDPIIPFLEIAKGQAIIEMHEYDTYFALCEEYISKERIIVGGVMGLRLLLNEELDMDCLTYELYTHDPYHHAKKVIDMIFQKTQDKYLFLQTNCVNREYTITTGSRRIIKFLTDGETELFEFSEPEMRRGYFSEFDIYVLNPFIQMMKIYQVLYSPGSCSLWEKYLNYEAHLSEIILHKTFGEGAQGGRDRQKKNHRENIADRLYQAFYRKMVYLGKTTDGRLQFISSADIKDDYLMVEKTLHEFKCKYVMQRPKIPEDFRLTRNTIYLISEKNTPIVDIFNSGMYEIIPHQNFKANIFVTLRFSLIDLWTVLYVKNIGKIDPQYAQKHLRAKLQKVRKLIDERKTLELTKLFPPPDEKNNFGIFVDERVDKRKIEKKNKFIPPYYPFITQSDTE
ncbi:MAG: hypothetical protein KAS12_01710 [Candidatus Aenigmarchaeota archaeon]|nr:hypothetical protein [Candidatus Aenigmarchaeota archaeon]